MAPLIPTLERLLFASKARSVQALIISLYNKSGKTLSQQRLWELTRSEEGINDLTEVFKESDAFLTKTKVKKQIAKVATGQELSYEELKKLKTTSIEVRTYFAKKS